MRSLVVGNWKMNGGLAANEALLAQLIDGVGKAVEREVAVCVPFPYLAQARDRLTGSCIAWGAQDVSALANGAYTGQVSASMLRDFDCRYAIVGHSERRHGLGEDDVLVGAKAAAALAQGIVPIACVGETLAERESDRTEAVVLRQLRAIIERVRGDVGKLVIAYEPVWAIGTGRNASPQQAQDVHARLREELRSCGAAEVPLLYGGSVKADNAAALFGQPDVDGGLVGGASLVAKEFLAICRA